MPVSLDAPASSRTIRTTTLTAVEIHNGTENEQSVSIRIAEDDETLYDEVETVPPEEEDGPSITEIADLPEDPGSYEVAFDLDRQRDDDGEYRERLDENGPECRGFILSIRPDSAGLELRVHRLSGCD